MLLNLLKNRIFLIVLVVGISVDQLSKYLAIKYLKNIDISDISFGFVYHENINIAFNIPIPGYIASLIAFALIIFILWKYGKAMFLKNNYTYIFLSFLITGAIGNIIDRITHGFVVDLIKLSIFPVFNIADIMITVAGIIFILYYKKLFKKQSSH
jgi:signal peptidase II